MTSHLVPTPIVNKNGVSTTVYKAVDKSAAAAASRIPAPAGVTITVPTSSKIMRTLKGTLDDPFVTTPSEITASRIERTLEGYPEDTQKYMLEVLIDNEEDTYLTSMVISMLDKRYSPEVIEDALFVFNSLVESWEAITADSDWTDDGFAVDDRLIQNINGARQYGFEIYPFGTEDKPLRQYDETTQKQALALIALAYEMDEDDELRKGLVSDDTAVYISDPSTVQHIVDNPDAVKETRDTLLQHGRVSWAAIEEIRNSASAPLREGTL